MNKLKKELEEIRKELSFASIKDKEYKDNFDLLEKAVGTPEHKKFLKIERELYKKECTLMKKVELTKKGGLK